MNETIKEKILSAISAAQDSQISSRMGSLSERDKLNAKNKSNLESQYIALAEYLLNDSMEPLYEAYVENNLSVQDIFWLIHAICTAGWIPDDGKEDEKEKRSLDYRGHEVMVGDLIPLHHDDVEQIMDIFMQKISEFVAENNNAVEEQLICAWIYMVYIVIHPYSDGNGRSSRGIVKFFDYAFQRKKGIPKEMCVVRSFPNRKDNDIKIEMAIKCLESAINYDKLVPTEYAHGSESSVNRYTRLARTKNAQAYFVEIKKQTTLRFLAVKLYPQLF